MVYQDLPSEMNPEVKVLAPVQDRFLAFAFDAALCFPALFIILKPMWRKIQYLSITAIDSMELKVLMVLCALAAILLFVLFNAVCLYKWGSTPGKKIFQIKVISIDGNPKIGFSQAALRSFVWTWQILCLGIPFLEVLSHHDRRPWHDRLSETMVLTNKRIRSDSPHWIEQHFFRNLYWALFSVLAITVGIEARSLLNESLSGEMRREELVRDGYLCGQLSEAMVSNEESHRLDFGLGLFLVGQVNSECLENELDFVLWSQDEAEAPWAYLTRGFLSEAAGNDATAEFGRACPEQNDSVVCSITKWKKTGEVTGELKNTWLYKIAHLKELIKLGQFEKLKTHINSVQWPTTLIPFVQGKGLQSIFVRGQEAAFAESYPILTAAWEHDVRIEMGSWGCLAQLTKNCESKTENSACEALRQEVTKAHGRTWPRPVALALAKENVCRGRNDKDTQSHFQRAFLKTPETAWVQDLVEMKSFDDQSWKKVSEAVKVLPKDDWLYAQGLYYLSQGALTLDRQKYLKNIFAESGSEDLFWWLAKNEYQKRESGSSKLNLRVPTSASENEK